MIGYPRATARQLDSRIKALRSLRVTRVTFEGTMRLGTLDILGKGYAGIVLAARRGTRDVALKIRRTDSPRRTMALEAKHLRRANSVGVGPELIAHSRDIIIMERVVGVSIDEWIQNTKSATRVRRILRHILESCRALDEARLDHGELSMISKHALVHGSNVTIIDFESASSTRRVSNVTSATQALFIGARLSLQVRRAHKSPTRKKIIALLRAYKSEMSAQTFNELLGGLNL